jgi:hypothetical protein
MLRVGLLCDGGELRLFDAELVRRLEAAQVAKVVLAIEQQLPERSLLERAVRALKRGSALRGAVFRAIVWLEQRITVPRRPEIDDLFRTVPVGEVCCAERLAVRPVVSPSGHVHRFAPEDIAAIKSRNLDLILRMGSGILRGEILNAAAHGIVSFHHGDNRTHRGGPAGFWEVLEKRDFSGYIVQRLTEQLDAGEVLARGEVATKARYLLNQHHLFKCSLASMVDVLARIGREGALERSPRDAAIDWYSNPLYSTPSVTDSLRYLYMLLGRALAGIARRLFVRRDVWELRLLETDWRALFAARARPLVPPRGRFWADPFIVSRSNAKVIFFEEYEFARGRAHIAALVGAGDGAFAYAGPVVEAPYHLSFPFVFHYQGRYYMCPETHEAGAIQLWRCVSFPLEWRFEKTIFAGIAACDTMLFESDGRWWLLTNLDRGGAGDFCRELHVFHSDSPLSEAWTPLPGNPVVTGASRARNAGLLQRDGRIYRLAQAQGFDLYGKSIRLFEITALSERDYRENLVAELLPGSGLRAKGVHHLSACEGAVVFDALRARFFWTRVFPPRQAPKRRPAAERPAVGKSLYSR